MDSRLDPSLNCALCKQGEEQCHVGEECLIMIISAFSISQIQVGVDLEFFKVEGHMCGAC